jgi:hypothetical protein
MPGAQNSIRSAASSRSDFYGQIRSLTPTEGRECLLWRVTCWAVVGSNSLFGCKNHPYPFELQNSRLVVPGQT